MLDFQLYIEVLMLAWINNQGVLSDEGWSYKRIDRFYYYYSEGNHNLKLMVESWEVTLKKESNWEPPFEDELISVEKVEQINCRVLEAIKFMGGRYQLVIR